MDYLGGDKTFEDSNFPYEAELRAHQQPRVLRIFSVFFREVESNSKFWIYGQPNSKCLHFFFCQLKFRSGTSISSLPTHEQSFGLFSIEPEVCHFAKAF